MFCFFTVTPLARSAFPLDKRTIEVSSCHGAGFSPMVASSHTQTDDECPEQESIRHMMVHPSSGAQVSISLYNGFMDLSACFRIKRWARVTQGYHAGVTTGGLRITPPSQVHALSRRLPCIGSPQPFSERIVAHISGWHRRTSRGEWQSTGTRGHGSFLIE